MEREKIIRLPIIYDSGGDSKKWFIEFQVLNPRSNKLELQRKYQGINSHHTIKGRYAVGEKMLNHWKDKLLQGLSPLVDQNVLYEDNLEFQTYIKIIAI